MIIHVRDTDGKMYSVEAQPTDTIHTLRVKIMLEGVPLSDYREIEFNGEHLRDTKATVSSYGICDEDCVDIKEVRIVAESSCGFFVNVVQPEGNVIRVVAAEAFPVIQIKHEVARKAGVEARKLQLRAGSENLKDEKMLRDYDITGESVVWLEVEGERGNGREKRREGEGAGDDRLKNGLLLVSLLVLVPLSLWLAYKGGNKNNHTSDKKLRTTTKLIPITAQSLAIRGQNQVKRAKIKRTWRLSCLGSKLQDECKQDYSNIRSRSPEVTQMVKFNTSLKYRAFIPKWKYLCILKYFEYYYRADTKKVFRTSLNLGVANGRGGQEPMPPGVTENVYFKQVLAKNV
nr:uncharacterized protein LOC113813268 [Penaeus vannamei]